MNAPIIFAVLGMVLVIFVFMAIWAARFVRVGPNQVFIISGRQRILPDGTRRGFRFVKGGGTFVIPAVEKAQVLSLEVVTVELNKSPARTTKGERIVADCIAQTKIKGDDDSIALAAEHFLGKNEAAFKDMIRLLLEKHLRTILGNLSIEEIGRDLEGRASKVHAAAAADLEKMGLALISFTIQDIHAA